MVVLFLIDYGAATDNRIHNVTGIVSASVSEGQQPKPKITRVRTIVGCVVIIDLSSHCTVCL